VRGRGRGPATEVAATTARSPPSRTAPSAASPPPSSPVPWQRRGLVGAAGPRPRVREGGLRAVV